MKRQSALELAAQGFRIFPIVPGTRVPPKNFPWKDKATTDTATIEGWWDENPEYNIGVAAGHGLLIIDADCKNGKPGLESLAMLDMMGLPESLRVTTPSGGVHVYLKSDVDFPNRVGSIPNYPGIDIRSAGGYVLGPGSTIDGMEYKPSGNALDPAPDWWKQHLAQSAPKHTAKSEHPLVELDKPEHIAKAIDWLANTAPEAIEGSGGDETTFKVAAWLRDLGLSPETALDLMLEHWNETKAIPPWPPEDLATKVENAFNYATGGWGAKTAAGEFGDVSASIGDIGRPPKGIAGQGHGQGQSHSQAEQDARKIAAKPFIPVDPATIPPREWLYGRHLMRKFVSVTVAPGGVGKSSLAIVEAVAMASGKPLLGYSTGRPLTVWYWNLEDPYDELQRRFHAVMCHYGVTAEDINGRLFVNSGRETPLKIAISDRNGARVIRPVVDAFTAEMMSLRVDAAIVDPFVSSHGVIENDNNGMDLVVKEWGRVADRANAAIELIHHTRKTNGDEVDSDSARGGRALIDAAREARVLNRMTGEEAEKAGVDNHRLYFRTYSDKANMAPPADRSSWFKLESVHLANGDDVGVVVSWEWPDPFKDITADHVRRVQDAVRTDTYRANIQSSEWIGFKIAEVAGLDLDVPAQKERTKALLREWVEKGWLVVRRVRDEKGKERPVVEAGSPVQEDFLEP